MKVRYKGALNKRIRLPAAQPRGWAEKLLVPTAPSERPPEEAQTSGAAVWVEKLLLLLDHYGIDRTDEERWLSLALRLAVDHVEGFQIERASAPGRPTEWGVCRLGELLADVIRAQMSDPASDKPRPQVVNESMALQSLVRSSSKYRGASKGTLQRRLAQAKAELSPLMIFFLSQHLKRPELAFAQFQTPDRSRSTRKKVMR